MFAAMRLLFRQVSRAHLVCGLAIAPWFHVSLHVSEERVLLMVSGLVICLTTSSNKNLIPLTCESSYIIIALMADIGCCFAAGGMYCLAPALATWMGLNTAGQAKRAAAIAFGVTATQFGGIVGSNIYISFQKRE
jgi:hypothetical protein